jgi:hypothetical protein
MIKLRQLKPELGRLCGSRKTKKELRRRLKAIKVIQSEFGPHLRAKWARMLKKRMSTSVLARIEWKDRVETILRRLSSL